MPTIKGNNLITWGTGSAGGLAVVQSASVKRGGEKVELYDEDGDTFCVIYFDDNNECEFEAIMQTDVTPPERGTTISIGGVTTALVDDYEIRYQNRDAVRLMVRAKAYDGVSAA